MYRRRWLSKPCFRSSFVWNFPWRFSSDKEMQFTAELTQQFWKLCGINPCTVFRTTPRPMGSVSGSTVRRSGSWRCSLWPTRTRRIIFPISCSYIGRYPRVHLDLALWAVVWPEGARIPGSPPQTLGRSPRGSFVVVNVLCLQKDGTINFCVDYWNLNDQTMTDAHPISRIDELLDRMPLGNFLMTIDICKGYWKIPLDVDARPDRPSSPHSACTSHGSCQ